MGRQSQGQGCAHTQLVGPNAHTACWKVAYSTEKKSFKKIICVYMASQVVQ